MDLTPISEAVRQATRLCQTVQQEHIVRSEKSGHEPVTIADYGSQAIICRAIQQHFPDDAVMSEEAGTQFLSLVADEQRAQIVKLIGRILNTSVTEQIVAEWLDHGKSEQASQMWVIDPIDGTKGFLAQRHYVVAVGYMLDRKPIGAVISAPEYPGGGRLLHALDGKAYSEPLGGGTPQQIHVSDNTEVHMWRGVESVEKSHAGHSRMAKCRIEAGMDEALVERADSMEKYGRIAVGDAELYLRLPRKGSTRPHSIWDHAPGAALVEAAGGQVSDVDGSPLDYSEGTSLQNLGVIVTNGTRHNHMVKAVQKILAAEEP